MAREASKMVQAAPNASSAGGTVQTSKSLPFPREISGDDFDELCRAFRIPISYRNTARAKFDDIARHFPDLMANQRQQPDRRTDREKLDRALSLIMKASAELGKNIGPSGRHAMEAISDFIAPMLSAGWINDASGKYAIPKSRMQSAVNGASPTRSPTRQPIRNQVGAVELFVEEHTLHSRLQFVRETPAETIHALLGEVERGLASAVRAIDLQPRSRGGRKPLVFRDLLLQNLVQMWDDLEREPSTTPQSEFVSFCEHVADAVGWQTDGICSAIPDAVKNWRNRARKMRR